ncbi:hypothetical protein [Photobacterium sanguinicancri]|uniref:hypothetical protein n=1 Tax=Photobacterium sanguinicancri TaxID=875932 RepID=UPI0021C3B347|nr:hypothetical protein [Photobacterium sanguinicancri]
MMKFKLGFFICFKSLLLSSMLISVNALANEMRFDVRSHTGASCSASKSLSRIKTGIRNNDNNGRSNNYNRDSWNEIYNNNKHLYLEVEIPFSLMGNNPSPSECLRILKQEERMRELELEAKEHEVEMLRQQLVSQENLLKSNTFVSN